jgi:hypothetical protein
VIEHLNSKLSVWNDQCSIVELIEKTVSHFPEREKIGIFHRFAAYFTILDLISYWKDVPTANSNVARLRDSAHAFFATGCNYPISEDKRMR